LDKYYVGEGPAVRFLLSFTFGTSVRRAGREQRSRSVRAPLLSVSALLHAPPSLSSPTCAHPLLSTCTDSRLLVQDAGKPAKAPRDAAGQTRESSCVFLAFVLLLLESPLLTLPSLTAVGSPTSSLLLVSLRGSRTSSSPPLSSPFLSQAHLAPSQVLRRQG
jgi:hypothetical protein